MCHVFDAHEAVVAGNGTAASARILGLRSDSRQAPVRIILESFRHARPQPRTRTNAALAKSWYSLQRWRSTGQASTQHRPAVRLVRREGRVTPATIADHHPPHGGDYNAFMHRAGPLALPAIAIKANGPSTSADIAWQIGDDGFPVRSKAPV